MRCPCPQAHRHACAALRARDGTSDRARVLQVVLGAQKGVSGAEARDLMLAMQKARAIRFACRPKVSDDSDDAAAPDESGVAGKGGTAK